MKMLFRSFIVELVCVVYQKGKMECTMEQITEIKSLDAKYNANFMCWK
jgi:hypothetical protein